ncbi:MAG TPA: Type 1 glutamine amidotransferase-like domain-containing protein [Candidatus Saccharimonadales bacterium]|nr:Type 1 glutamine amidotransferase-like domain-containing protein [Candidatus Saccharimonadales bacterium]
MKLLLTSGGLTNETLRNTFKELTNKPRVSFILTASLVEPGDKSWLFKDVQALYELGAEAVDLLDIACLGPSELAKRLEWSNCLFVEGGNTAYLMHCFKKSGLINMLPKLLTNKLYVGVSAGSMIMGYRLPIEVGNLLYAEDSYVRYNVTELLGFRDFIVVPHFEAEQGVVTPELLTRIKQETGKPVYALDDQSALLFEDTNVTVLSEGRWEKA